MKPLRQRPQFGVRLNLRELVDDGLDCLAMMPSDVQQLLWVIHVRRTDGHLLLLQSSSASRMTAGATTRPVIREKSQFCAQDDSLSLSHLQLARRFGAGVRDHAGQRGAYLRGQVRDAVAV